jgi:hypothetical protein
MSSNIAMWGDSMTTLVASNLQLLMPQRTVFNQGYVGWTSSQIAAVQLADTTHQNWVSTFWYGHNNKAEPERIKADIAASVAHLAPGNMRFVVIGLVNRADGSESRGTPGYAALLALNAELAATYGANYLDVRSLLVASYNPNLPQDVADFNADVPPASLRNDEIHLRNDGSVIVAQRIRQFIEAKGW